MQGDFSEEVRVKVKPQGLAGLRLYVEAGGRMFLVKNMQRPRGKNRWSSPRPKLEVMTGE